MKTREEIKPILKEYFKEAILVQAVLDSMDDFQLNKLVEEYEA